MASDALSQHGMAMERRMTGQRFGLGVMFAIGAASVLNGVLHLVKWADAKVKGLS